MSDDRFDGMFLSVAQQSQGIEPLLDHVFGFLRRKTDFFTGADEKTVDDLVLKVVHKHSSLSRRDKEEKSKLQQKEKKRLEELEQKKKLEEQQKKARSQAQAEDDDVLELSADGTFDTAFADKSSPTVPAPKAAEPPAVPESVSNNESSAPPVGNGGRTDKYSWVQTLSEVTVTIPVPAGTKTRALDIDIANKKLRVGLKGQPPLVSGELHKRIIVDDSFWTLEDNDVVLNLQKDNKMEWWKCVVVGDAEIDTQKVQPENSKLGDLDGETRQTVEKMMFDQRQKALGLPSSDELQKQEMMKKFMAAHPEMDFSQAKFS